MPCQLERRRCTGFWIPLAACSSAAKRKQWVDLGRHGRFAFDKVNHRGGDFDEARNALASYRNWRRRGGFQPDGGDDRAAELERKLLGRGMGRSQCDEPKV